MRAGLIKKRIRDKNGKATSVWVRPKQKTQKRSRKPSNVEHRWWHGTPSGDLRGASNGLHIGTHEAARQALEARIGVPAEGDWDGTREYGKTLLAGRKTLERMKKEREHYYPMSGFNASPPEEDYYVSDVKHRAKYGDGTEVPLSTKPSILPVEIVGEMSNSQGSPYDDFKANGYMSAAKKRGNAKRGYYYTNVAEDGGSISAVVPDGSHIRVRFDEWFKGSKVTDNDGNKESIGKVVVKDGLDKFLEGSVVKDVVYHATRSDFNAFNNIKQELGTHVGTMRQARDRAEVGRIRLTSDKFLYTSNTSIMPLYISIKNPLELTDNGGFKFIDIGKQLIDRGIITKRDWESIISSNNEQMYDPLLKRLLKEKGYDSIKYLNRFEGLLNEEYTNENFAKINSVNRMNLSDKDFKKRFPLAEYSYIVFDAGRIKSATGNDGNFDPTKPDITKAE